MRPGRPIDKAGVTINQVPIAPSRARWHPAGALWPLLRHGRVAADGRDQLAELADALAEPGPVDPRGAARAWLLVTDGTGPLYSRGNLRGYAASATRYLRPTPRLG